MQIGFTFGAMTLLKFREGFAMGIGILAGIPHRTADASLRNGLVVYNFLSIPKTFEANETRS